MASLATIVRGFVGVQEQELLHVATRPRAETCRLRPLANEDVYLYVKRIDNTAVVRAADPAGRKASFRAVAAGFAIAMMVIAGLFPAAYNTMEGYHIQQLRQEQMQLKQESATLTVQAAAMLSPDNLNRMASKLKMVDPTPQQVQFLESNNKNVARNHLPLRSELAAH
ncbi:MAG TPA: hypothetical protein VF023_03365 [Bryobacteraceae bacterium]|jgi:hypothetical protein